MANLGKDLEKLFDLSLSREVQEALLKILFGSYQTAFEACLQFEKEEAQDLLGYYRWIQVRSDLRGLGGRFHGIQVIPQRWHTLVISGQIMFTASSVQDPEEIVKHANYRDSYAISSQLDLFEEQEPISEDAKFYCILLHGHDSNNRKQPAFAKIVFPSKDCQTYVHEIDLFSRYESLINNLSRRGEQEPPIRPLDLPEENQS